MQTDDPCGNPSCTTGIASETYEGPHGNELDVCRKCYWRLVTGQSTSHTTGWRPVCDDGTPGGGESLFKKKMRRRFRGDTDSFTVTDDEPPVSNYLGP